MIGDESEGHVIVGKCDSVETDRSAHELDSGETTQIVGSHFRVVSLHATMVTNSLSYPKTALDRGQLNSNLRSMVKEPGGKLLNGCDIHKVIFNELSVRCLIER